MKFNRYSIIILPIIICTLFFTPLSLADTAQTEISPETADKLAVEAYIYGYPLVTMAMTREIMTNTTKIDAYRAPIGQMLNAKKFPNASFRDITSPNADTLYSIAWLDLAKEPYILHVPNIKKRYYVMPILDGWTNIIGVPGTRTNQGKATDYLIVGPNWKGKTPSGMQVLKSTTDIAWILGRTYCNGTSEDYQAVHQIQEQYKLTPLSYYKKTYTPLPGAVNPNIDMTTPVRHQVNQLDAAQYFTKLAMLLKNNPPVKEDVNMVANLKSLGILSAKDFDFNQLDPTIIEALNKSIKAGQEKIKDHKINIEIRNGWTYSLKTGLYSTDYLQRAFIAYIGLGANLPQDAIYPNTSVDNLNKPLDGKNIYIIHFVAGQLPPVNAFWSLTMYTDRFYFVENPLNKYALGYRNKLVKNPDGSVDIYIQHESPGKDHEANWLPAPVDKFNLMFRFYWPDEKILNGQWLPPRVIKVY